MTYFIIYILIKVFMGKLIVNGIRLDSLLSLPHETVFDRVPYEEHSNYLFRGANVGRLALNLLQDKRFINPFDDLVMHAGDHREARSVAAAEATYIDRMQFDAPAMEAFFELTGERPTHFPAIVLGLPKAYEARMVIHEQNNAHVIQEEVPFQAVDPYSRRLLNIIFDTDVAVR